MTLFSRMAWLSPAPPLILIVGNAAQPPCRTQTAAMTSLGIGTGYSGSCGPTPLRGRDAHAAYASAVPESLKLWGSFYLLSGGSRAPVRPMPDPRTSGRPMLFPGITAFRQGFLTNVQPILKPPCFCIAVRRRRQVRRAYAGR